MKPGELVETVEAAATPEGTPRNLPINEYLTESEFCERYRVRPRTAQRWRGTGQGPPWCRVGPRKIVYRLSDCERWAASHTFPHRAAELARCLVLIVGLGLSFLAGNLKHVANLDTPPFGTGMAAGAVAVNDGGRDMIITARLNGQIDGITSTLHDRRRLRDCGWLCHCATPSHERHPNQRRGGRHAKAA